MADKSTPKPMGGLTNREQDVLVAALSKCLKSDIQIDYAKLATETGLKDAKSAGAAWGPIKKKFFGIASVQAGAASGPANKVTKPKTPRKPKEPKDPKTPSSITKKASKSAVKVEEEEEEEDVDEDEAASDEETNDNESKVKVEGNVTNGASSSSPMEEPTGSDEHATEDADGDSTMVDTLESVGKGKGKASVADDLSSGDMSPPKTPAPTKAKKAATPKAKATPKTPETPTVEDANTTPGDATETPVPGSGPKKRGRKTNAQKEAEAAAAGQNGDDDEGEKPAKKPRKAPVKKVKKEDGANEREAAGAVEGDGGEKEKEKAVKKPRKHPVKKPKKEDGAEIRSGTNADANDGEDEETEKPVRKPRKTPVKKEKKEDAAPAGEGSPAGEAVKEKKQPGPKPGATKAKKAATAVESAKPEATDEGEQEKINREAAAKVVEAAELANEVLSGKKIENKVASTTDATLPSPSWGTPLNGDSPIPTKGKVTVQLGKEFAVATAGTDEEADGDTIVIASEVVQSIEVEEDEAGDTITVATR